MLINKYLWLGLTAWMMFMVGVITAQACNENNNFYAFAAVWCLVIYTIILFSVRRATK